MAGLAQVTARIHTASIQTMNTPSTKGIHTQKQYVPLSCMVSLIVWQFRQNPYNALGGATVPAKG